MIATKDTVTYPLSAITGDEEESRIEHLERELAKVKEQLRLCNVDQFTTAAELAEARAEIERLKGEAESWEKVFDKTCEHLAETKEQRDEKDKQLATCYDRMNKAEAQRDLAVEALEIIGECLIMKVKFPENATAAITANMIKKVLKECGK